MPQSVTLNGTSYEIERFKALKAVLAIASITRISREVPDIMAKAVKEYSNRNTITLTREIAKLPRWEGSGFTDEDFAAAPDGRIEIPAASMTAQEQVMVALPELFENARKETVRLLAILIVPNAKLREADKDGGTTAVNSLLDQFEDTLLYDAELDEVAELLAVSYEVLESQLADKKDRLGKLVAMTMRLLGRQLSTPPEIPTTAATTETPATSTPASQTSSTVSPTPTAGEPSAPLTPTGVA